MANKCLLAHAWPNGITKKRENFGKHLALLQGKLGPFWPTVRKFGSTVAKQGSVAMQYILRIIQFKYAVLLQPLEVGLQSADLGASMQDLVTPGMESMTILCGQNLLHNVKSDTGNFDKNLHRNCIKQFLHQLTEENVG